MGFLSTVTEAFRESFKPKLNWKSTSNNVSGLFSKERRPAVVAVSIDDIEFLVRYKNVRISAFSSLFFICISFLSLPFVTSWSGFTTVMLSFVLFTLFYYRYAFILWVCRKSWSMSIDLESPVKYTAGSYFKAIGEDAAELLPKKLPTKKGNKK
jgi:hypothetical protein